MAAEVGEAAIGFGAEVSLGSWRFSKPESGSWKRGGIGEAVGGKGVPFSSLARVAGSGWSGAGLSLDLTGIEGLELSIEPLDSGVGVLSSLLRLAPEVEGGVETLSGLF